MRISNISFGKIYQVIGDKQNMKEFITLVDREQISSGNKAFVYNALDVVPKRSQTAEMLKDKSLYFVVTGDDYVEEVRNNERSSLAYLLGCTDKVISVGKNIKRDAIEVFNSIKENL